MRRVVQQQRLQRGLRGVAVPRVGVPLAAELQALLELLRREALHEAAQDARCLIRPALQRSLHDRQQPPCLAQPEGQRCGRAVVLVLCGGSQQPSKARQCKNKPPRRRPAPWLFMPRASCLYHSQEYCMKP